MSPAQKRGWEQYGSQFIIPYQDQPISFFTDDPQLKARPTKVDIGFGMGRELAQLAEEEPGTNFIGIEVHKPGVGRLLLDLGERGISNVRIIPHDAVAVCHRMIPEDSVDGVHLFFPDPWPKERHKKRRLVRPGFPELIHRILKNDGYLYMVTDWEDYAHQMLALFTASPLFENRYSAFAPPQPWRPQTAFERKGLAKGHTIFELVFVPLVVNPC